MQAGRHRGRHGYPASFLFPPDRCGQKVIGLVAAFLRVGETTGGHKLGQPSSWFASGLITLQRLMSVGRLIETVPAYQHGARFLSLVQAEKEVAKPRIAPAPLSLRRRMVFGSAWQDRCERVSVDDQERASLCHRFNNHGTRLRSRLISSEVASGT
jgi:hypothetical protein